MHKPNLENYRNIEVQKYRIVIETFQRIQTKNAIFVHFTQGIK